MRLLIPRNINEINSNNNKFYNTKSRSRPRCTALCSTTSWAISTVRSIFSSFLILGSIKTFGRVSPVVKSGLCSSLFIRKILLFFIRKWNHRSGFFRISFLNIITYQSSATFVFLKTILTRSRISIFICYLDIKKSLNYRQSRNHKKVLINKSYFSANRRRPFWRGLSITSQGTSWAGLALSSSLTGARLSV